MMRYTKIAWILVLSVLLCGCANVTGQVEETPGENVSGDAPGQDGTGVSGGNTENGQSSIYAYSGTTVIDTLNGGDLVYRADEEETIAGAAGSPDMLFVLIYRDAVLNGVGGDATGSGHAPDMPYSLLAVNRNANFPKAALRGAGFISAGVELNLTDGYPKPSQDMSALSENTVWNETRQEIDTFSSTISGEILGYYQGKLYMVYRAYEDEEDAWHWYAYCYEQQPDGGFARSQDALCMTVMDLYSLGYRFCGDAEEMFAGLDAYGRLLVWKQEEAKIYAVAVDGSIVWERQIDPKVTNIQGTDGRFLTGVGFTQDAGGGYYSIYDLEGTFYDGTDVREGTYVWSDGSYLGMSDGYLYYYRYNKTSYEQNQYTFYRYNLYDAEAGEELLYETSDVVGQPYQMEGNNGIAGFTVQGDTCYFMDFDEGSLWWYSCDLSDDAHTLTRLDAVDEYHGIFDAGEITYVTDSYQCGECGELIYEYYVEGIQLYEEAVMADGQPVEDAAAIVNKINEVLAEERNRAVLLRGEQLETYRTQGTSGEHICGSYTGRSTFEVKTDGVTRYRFRKEGQEEELVCLEVDYSGYDYTGGAHGYPWRSHLFFNLSDGSAIGMADVIGVSEEEFRTLAAEYTVADYRGENRNLYFETEEDTLYETVYEYAGFDCSMYLGADGVVVEYSPYQLGPYASGTIEVTIPYEKLGLEAAEIYGVNE